MFLRSSFFKRGWMVLNCDWMLFKCINKANLYTLKKDTLSKTAVFNHNPMEIPPEPIRKERICQNFIRSLGGESRFLVHYCESDKMLGGAFTIVDATLAIQYLDGLTNLFLGKATLPLGSGLLWAVPQPLVISGESSTALSQRLHVTTKGRMEFDQDGAKKIASQVVNWLNGLWQDFKSFFGKQT